jgi:hypothetical protein
MAELLKFLVLSLGVLTGGTLFIAILVDSSVTAVSQAVRFITKVWRRDTRAIRVEGIDCGCSFLVFLGIWLFVFFCGFSWYIALRPN